MPSSPIKFITANDISAIHAELVAWFAGTSDPIIPSGVKSQLLLESAVDRQHVCLGNQEKYPTVFQKAATLLYGITLNHPFHNGNKRTALATFLVFLDLNNLVYYRAHDELFDLVLDIARHTLTAPVAGAGKTAVSRNHDADREVDYIARWTKDKVRSIKRGDRSISVRELRKILANYDYEIGPVEGSSVPVLKKVSGRGFRLFKPHVQTTTVFKIPYHSEKEQISISVIQDLRRTCNLTERDGVDSNAFYSGTPQITSIINQYRTLLWRLRNK